VNVKVEIVVEVVAEKGVDFGLGEHVFSCNKRNGFQP